MGGSKRVRFEEVDTTVDRPPRAAQSRLPMGAPSQPPSRTLTAAASSSMRALRRPGNGRPSATTSTDSNGDEDARGCRPVDALDAPSDDAAGELGEEYVPLSDRSLIFDAGAEGEGVGVPVEPFNLVEERRRGHFDPVTGGYVPRARSAAATGEIGAVDGDAEDEILDRLPDEDPEDAWIEDGVRRSSGPRQQRLREQQRQGQRPQEEEEGGGEELPEQPYDWQREWRAREARAAAAPAPPVRRPERELRAALLRHFVGRAAGAGDSDTAAAALARLGAAVRAARAQNDAATVRARRADIDALTGIMDELLHACGGVRDVYRTPVRDLDEFRIRWSADGDEYGPFPLAQMSAWAEQGYFETCPPAEVTDLLGASVRGRFVGTVQGK